ncbi:hypothetical protein [Pseudobacillus wudalianchiensis]|uniref:hypothetical protein n=1 Tax=Pseudobacillus wudalianchiensis TaxID=1743143 RepID=UPI00114766DB|nr:hypothetical protein [Bacillus wudalianchiensis]
MVFLSFLVTIICLIGSITGLMSNPTNSERTILIGWLVFGIVLFIVTVFWYRKRRRQGKIDDLSDCCDCPPSTFNLKGFDCDKDGDCDCSPDCSS